MKKKLIIPLLAVFIIAATVSAFVWAPTNVFEKEQTKIENVSYFATKLTVITPQTYIAPETEQYIIIKQTDNATGKKFMRMAMLTPTYDEKDAVERMEQSKLETHIIAKITKNLIQTKPEKFEGIIEKDYGVIEYRYKQYGEYSAFSISQNNIDVIKFIGRTELCWLMIRKINRASQG